jgi:hypothetical protein
MDHSTSALQVHTQYENFAHTTDMKISEQQDYAGDYTGNSDTIMQEVDEHQDMPVGDLSQLHSPRS